MTDEAPDFANTFTPQHILPSGLGQIGPRSTQLQLANVTSRCQTWMDVLLLFLLRCAEAAVLPAEPSRELHGPRVSYYFFQMKPVSRGKIGWGQRKERGKKSCSLLLTFLVLW